MPRFATLLALLGLATIPASPSALAVEAPTAYAEPTTEAALSDRMNAHTVAIITGTPGGTYFRAGADLAFALDDGDRLRILPILGRGAGENAYDIRFLKGVDLGFVRTDTLTQLRQDKRLKNIERQIHFIAKLFNDELHIIAPNDIATIRDLAGKRVSFDVKGSGTDYSGRAMFRELGVGVEAVNVDQATAVEMLRKGELQAIVSVAAKPVAFITAFDPGDRFHFVSTPFPDTISDAYVPATIASADYPKLVRGSAVETMAVGSILAAYNSQKGTARYDRLTRFVDAFFGKFDKLLAPQRHPKWREVNLAASANGWTRFRPAQEWLDRHQEQDIASQGELDRFVRAQPERLAGKEEVYQAYLNWRRTR